METLIQRAEKLQALAKMPDGTLFDTVQAAEVLRVLGIARSAKTLAWNRSRHGGPTYIKLDGVGGAKYRLGDLKKFAGISD